MTNRADSVRLEGAHSTKREQPIGGSGFDWAMIAVCTWFLGGLYLDGWAHHHIPALESFFTPWHGVFYSGFFAVASLTVGALVRNYVMGYPWRGALPAGYELSWLGVLIFAAAGVSDMIWHEFFGIEASIDALLRVCESIPRVV